MAKIKAGVLGATGAVGQRFIEGLQNHPWFEITSIAASERSAGKKYKEAARWRLESELPADVAEMTVVNVDPKEVDADIVFSALPANEAQTAEPAFAAAGFAVASNTSSYRMVADVPLLIPECNYEHLDLIKVQQEIEGLGRLPYHQSKLHHGHVYPGLKTTHEVRDPERSCGIHAGRERSWLRGSTLHGNPRQRDPIHRRRRGEGGDRAAEDPGHFRWR